jgi:hypothetical protein
MKAETVKIVNEDSDEGFCIINEDDFDPETMEMFEGKIPDDEDTVDPVPVPVPVTEEEVTLFMTESEDDVFDATVNSMTVEECKSVLEISGVEFNKNFGVKKMRKAVSEARASVKG